MSAIVYPPTLPGPTAAPLQGAERRMLSSTPGPRQARALQRDRLAQQQVTFVFTHAQVAVFAAWVASNLVRAGAWFAANWPLPQGGTGVYRFIGEPSYPEYLAGAGWRVSATCEVRGRGTLPKLAEQYTINLDGIANAGASSVSGITLSGLDPDNVYELTEPAGLTFIAWRSDAVGFPNNYHNRFSVTTSGGTTVIGTTGFATAALAREAFPGAALTGYSAYTFWIDDSPNLDNDGGLSIQMVWSP